jgi:hypothetical protein
MTMLLLSVAGAAGIIFSAEVEIKSPNFAKGDMHQGVEIKIIYEFLSAETRFFGYHLTRRPLWGCFVREGPNHQSPITNHQHNNGSVTANIGWYVVSEIWHHFWELP